MLMWCGSDPLAPCTYRKQSSDDRPPCLENPRPAGAESTLTENVASPFQAEPTQGDKRKFTVYPKHVPKPTCYAHSELWCASPNSEDARPSESAKEKLRILLSRALKVKIPATA